MLPCKYTHVKQANNMAKSPRTYSIDDYLRLIPSDTQDVPTPPDVSSLPPLAARKALAAYYRSLADHALSSEHERRARTRAMIILGARVSTIADPVARRLIRDHMASTDRPGDYAAVCEVVEWMRPEPEEATQS
jgi:hypothetical protein